MAVEEIRGELKIPKEKLDELNKMLDMDANELYDK